MRHILRFVLLLSVSLAWVAHSSELDGSWRAVLKPQAEMRMVLGLDIKEGKASFSSPNQASQGRSLDSFDETEGKVSFDIAKLGVTFTGQHEGDEIVGTFTQGQTFPLTFYRLDAAGIERLAYEHQYLGTLSVQGQELPLRVNVGVTKDGFLGTFDSLAQQSYGIPLDALAIDANKLQFAATAIGASYRGEVNANGDYEGVWAQGTTLPLTFSEVTNETPVPEIKTAEVGEQGGALAILTPDNVEVSYFGEHDASTAYEIGSVSKTFVAYLLAVAVRNNELALSTPLADFYSGAPTSITLESLATHTSGLPRLPANLSDGVDPKEPYVHFDDAALSAALQQQSVTDTTHAYSNFGSGALGEALARAQKSSLQELMQQRIFKPFGMTHSHLALAGQPLDKQLATPHDAAGNVMPAWRFQALAGAGAIVSTLPDMVKYVQQLQARVQEDDQLAQLLLSPRLSMSECCEQALGWFLQKDAQGKIFAWHNGQTAGFVSYVGFYLDGSRAVVLLNNQVADARRYAEPLLTTAKD